MSISLKELKQRKESREAAIKASHAKALKLIRVTVYEGFKQNDVVAYERGASESIVSALSKVLNDVRDPDWYDVQPLHPDDEDEEMKYLWIICKSQDTFDRAQRNFPPDFVERFVGKTIMLYPDQPGNRYFKEQVSCLLEMA